MNNIVYKLEKYRHKGNDGKSYWSARELRKVLNYSTYQKFDLLIKRSFNEAKKSGYSELDLFSHEVKMVDIGSNTSRKITDYNLSILACLFITKCADGKREEIIEAKEYFSIQNDDINCDTNCIPLVSPSEKEKIKADNLRHWQKNTKKASQVYINKMGRLNLGLNQNERLLEEFYRDDSYIGNPSPHHIIYKLGEPLISADKKRAYEFLIEYDIYEPSTGIYYGCKGLTLNDNHNKNITQFNEEWKSISELAGKVLSNIFPGKKFALRFKTTNNANNNTYWPFWITLYEEEDIIEVAARAVKVIKEIFQNELKLISSKNCNVSIHKLGEIVEKNARISKQYPKDLQCTDLDKTKTTFTNDAYNELKKKIGKENLENIIHRLEQKMKIYKASNYYKNTWLVKCSQQDFAEEIDIIFKELGQKVCWKYIEGVFIKEKHQTMINCLRQAANEAKHHKKRNKRIKS